MAPTLETDGLLCGPRDDVEHDALDALAAALVSRNRFITSGKAVGART
jgi:hypothetical protein